jgi:HEAT repeat protein
VATAASALSEADAERALEVCSALVSRDDAAIASAAVTALGRLSNRASAEGGLLRALHHTSDEVVKLALSELGRAPSAAAVEAMGRCLAHPAWEVRRVAAEVLGADGSPEATAHLRASLERETDATVREAIMLALASPFGATSA